jgi:hypothetical protein
MDQVSVDKVSGELPETGQGKDYTHKPLSAQGANHRNVRETSLAAPNLQASHQLS